jgi:hypothetical protein
MTVRIVSQPSPGDLRDHIRLSIMKEMEKVAEEGKQLFEQVTSTWSSYTKPTFAVHSQMDPGQIAVRIQLQAPTASAVDTDISVFGLLDDGTDVRYAHMTSDFAAKTAPGSLFASAGSGGFSHLGYALPGIQAREFSDSVAKAIQQKMEDAINRGAAEALKTL